jgi:hypothetical protein
MRFICHPVVRFPSGAIIFVFASLAVVIFELKECKYTMQNTLTIKSNIGRQSNYLITCVPLFVALTFFIGCKGKDITLPDPNPVDPPVLFIEKANYYVAPDGNDANPRTIDKPFKNWDKIIKLSSRAI